MNQQLTGFSPYNFQTQAIAPFPLAKTLNLDFPNKLICVVLLRTLRRKSRIEESK